MESFTFETIMGDFICKTTGENREKFPELYPNMTSDAMNYKEGFIKGVTSFVNLVHALKPAKGEDIAEFLSSEESPLMKIDDKKDFSMNDDDVSYCFSFIRGLTE